MAEYIEKETALEIVKRTSGDYAAAFSEIAHLPAAAVAEVRHGRWFFKYTNGWACSRCGEWGLMIDNRGIYKSSYCPNCGARMDKEDEHEAG